MANKIVSLLLQVKNAISPGVNEASKDLDNLRKRTTELEKELSKVDSANAAIKSLDDVKQAAKDAEQAFDDAQLNVIKLKDEFKTTKTPELAIALEKAKIEAREAKKEFIANGKALSNLESTITRAGGDLDDLAGSEKKFTDAIDNTNGKLIAHNEKLNKAEKNFKDTGTAAETSGNSIKGFAAKLVGLVAGVAIISKIKDGFVSLAKSVFETGSQFELLGKRLSAKELGYITEFARDTPLQLDGVAQAFAKLRAFGVDPMNGSLRALVDQNAALGGSQETLEGIITAVGQAWGKQKLQQEEVLQLVERGVPAWDLLAKATGRTVPELQKMATAGELGRKEISLLLAEIAKANEGEAAEAMNTLSGIVSNLKDDFTAFYLRISNNGALDSLKGAIKDVRAEFQAMADDGRLEAIARAVSDFFVGVIQWGGDAVRSLNVNFGTIVGTAQIISNSIAVVFNGLRAGVTGAVSVVAGAVSSLAKFAGFDDFAAKADFVAQGFNDAFSAASVDVKNNLSGISDGASQFGQTFDSITKSAAAASNAAVDTADAVKRTGDTAKTAGQDGAAALKLMADTMVDTSDEADKTANKVTTVKVAVDDLAHASEDADAGVRLLAESLSGFFTGIRNDVAALSEEARQAFDNRLGISSAGAVTEIGALEEAIVSAREELGKIAIDNLQVFDPTGINRWKNSVLQARDETVIAYNEQKLKALEYIDALQSGEGVNASFIRNAETSIGNMKLLGSQDLAQLRSALDSANQKLLQMKSNAADALGNLQNELDQLQGNTAAIAQREYEQKKADLEAKLKEARLYGQNEAIAAYEQALKVLEQVRNEQRKQSNSAAAASNNNASPAGANYGPAPGSVTTIKLQSPSGTSEVALNGDRDAVNKLLDVLGDAGLRSAN